MNLVIFQNRLHLLVRYARKLKKYNIPIRTQRVLLKEYSYDLKFNLTNRMILEIIYNNPTSYWINRAN